MSARKRARDLGIRIGVLPAGQLNAITDVAGVRVGHVTLSRGESIRTGVTAIIPGDGNLFQQKFAAAVYVGNGYGKLGGGTQIEELGQIETPIVLTNTLGVAAAIEAVVEYTLSADGNESVRSVNAVVGETNDGWLNDIRGRHVSKDDVLAAIHEARGGAVEEGCVGAGTGTVCFGFKGGIGTASRTLPASLGGYTVGALVQTNFGGVLQIDGVPVGKALGKFTFSDKLPADVDGSCMMIVATDAPIDARNLKRLAKRAFMGLAKTGGIAAQGSGDYVIAFSTHPSMRIPHRPSARVRTVELLHDEYVSPLFMAAIESTDEAIVNSLLMAETTTGIDGHRAEALPIDRLTDLLRTHNWIQT
jgi:D-aminopeptidase